MKPSLLSLTALLCALPVAVAQEPAAGPGGTAAEAAQPLSAQQARDDVRLLRTLAQLDLSAQQIAKIIPHLEQVQTLLSDMADRRAKSYQQQRTALEATRDALVGGDAPRPTAYDSIQRALRQLQLSTQVQLQRVLQVEASIQAELTEQQLGRIETREQREAREARVRELEGETTAAGYIVKKLREIRELLPDEYARVRLRGANEIAIKTEGPRSPRFNAYRQRVLLMMDQAYGLTTVEFQRQLPTLSKGVATTLEIRPDADAPSVENLIPYEEYAELVRSPRTLELLREMLERRGGGTGA